MAVTKEISQLTPKGSNLSTTDLYEVSILSGGAYASRSITGQQIINAVFPFYKNFIYGFRLMPDYGTNSTTVRVRGAAPANIYPNDSICIDSTGTFFIYTTDLLSIGMDIATNGAGGLDTGTAANNTRYFAYIIADSTGVNQLNAVASLSYTGVTGGLVLPTGYDKYRLIGSFKTKIASNNICEFLQSGVSNERTYVYLCDYPQNRIATVTTAGAHTLDMAPYVSPLSSVATLLIGLFAASGEYVTIGSAESWDVTSAISGMAQVSSVGLGIYQEVTVAGGQSTGVLNKIVVDFTTSTGGSGAQVYARAFKESI